MSILKQNPSRQVCSLPRRVAAITYDGLALVAIWMVGTAVIVMVGNRGIDSGNLFYQLYLLALAFAYFHASWLRVGQTLGMRTWRLWIEADEPPFTLAHSLRRFAAGLASIATLGLGFAWALGRNDRRGWPDLLSRSRLFYYPNSRSAAQDK